MADENGVDIATGEIVDATQARQAAVSLYDYNPDLDFRKLALESAYHAKGFRLVDKETLIGVPFIVTNVTYREGFPRPGAGPGDYVSVEAVVADQSTLDQHPVKSQLPENLAVFPNEPVVFNDGGTGIRRALTQLYASIDPPNGPLINPGKAKGEENPFDRPYQRWQQGSELAELGISHDLMGKPVRYLAVRGLRKSEYDWQDEAGNPHPAVTYYFG